MAFRYINPGLKDLFTIVSGGATQGYDSSLIYSRTSGDYFSFTGESDRSFLQLEPNNEYWVAICFYPVLEGSFKDEYFLQIYSQTSNAGIYLYRPSYTNNLGLIVTEDNINNTEIAVLNKGMLHNIEIYVKNAIENGQVIIWLNGEKVYEYTGKTGNGEQLDKLYLAGTFYSHAYYFSDIIVQNTGRIGNLRVNRIPAKTGTAVCEWCKCIVPVGYKMQLNGTYLLSGATAILIQHKFTLSGTINKVFAKGFDSDRILLKFCVYRLNIATGKYNPTEVTEIYQFASTDVQEIILNRSMVVEPEDYFAVCVSGNGIIAGVASDIEEYAVFWGDATTKSEVTIPKATYKYKPCILALFTPDDTSRGANLFMKIDDPTLASYGGFETKEADKIISYTPDADNLQIGRIDMITVLASAHYEGDSIAKSVCSVMESHNGEPKALTTTNKLYNLDTTDKNPLTGLPWTISTLQAMQVGIKSKI